MSSRMDLIAVTGEYTNANGEKKKRYQKVGSFFDKDGNMSIKLDSVPVGNWDGWLSIKPPLDNTRQNPQPSRGKRSNDFDDVDF